MGPCVSKFSNETVAVGDVFGQQLLHLLQAVPRRLREVKTPTADKLALVCYALLGLRLHGVRPCPDALGASVRPCASQRTVMVALRAYGIMLCRLGSVAPAAAEERS
jgi:hypothetical protein